MRILLSVSSKRKLLDYLKKKNKVKSLKELSTKLKISKNTLDNWFYNINRYIPLNMIPPRIISKLEIRDKQKENWGKVKGERKPIK